MGPNAKHAISLDVSRTSRNRASVAPMALSERDAKLKDVLKSLYRVVNVFRTAQRRRAAELKVA